MRDVSQFLPMDGFFRRLGLRGQVVMCQLPLSLTILLVVAVTGLFDPATVTDGLFLLTLPPHLVLLGVCALVPWSLLPRGSFTIVPALDCLAVGFTREAGGPNLSILGLLLVFPVVWLSVSRYHVRVVLAVAATALSAIIPPLAVGTPFTAPMMIRTILLPVVMAAIAMTAHLVSRAVLRQRTALESKDRELECMLAESEQRKRLLDGVMETVDVGVLVVGSGGNEVLSNRRFQADLAQARETDPEDPSRARVPLFAADGITPVSWEDNPLGRAADAQSFTDELFWAGTGRNRRAYSATARPLQDEAGAFSGSVIAFTDVTALVTALSAKDNFVATISHELRTPLTSILGYLELILDEPDPSGAKPELLIIERNAERLLDLVNDLLAVAADSVNLTTQDADLADVLEESLDAAKPHATMRGVVLTLDAHRPLTARFDPGRIRQVLDNLISNAVKFSPDGGRVTLTAATSGEKVVCTVRDEGIGMDQDEQDQAFTKFFRAARARDTAIPGAGLGLPISKTIIENHHGTISLTSTPGKGTAVTFTLPFDDDELPGR